VKNYTPEQLSDERSVVEDALFTNVNIWFIERGITLSRVSLTDWDFTSPDVAQTFDESISSQRKITEQTALLEAAKISRERQLYEVDTAVLVAGKNVDTMQLYGFNGNETIQYLWIKYLTEAGDNDPMPDTLILNTTTSPTTPTGK